MSLNHELIKGERVAGDGGRRGDHEGHFQAAAAVDGAADPPSAAAGAAQDGPRSRRQSGTDTAKFMEKNAQG